MDHIAAPQVWDQKPVGLDDWDVALLRQLDGLAEREVIDLLSA